MNHVFYVAALPATEGRIGLEKREAEHLFKTLRGAVGDVVQLCDGRGAVAEAVIEPDKMLRIGAVTRQPRARRGVHLYTALPRNAKLDALLKPAAEIGVFSITPLTCVRSVATIDAIPERWHALLVEGCKQSKNAYLPELRAPLKLAAAVAASQARGECAFYGDPRGSVGLPETVLHGDGDLAWFVGPEGGFTETEEQIMREAGFYNIRLGFYVLRLETAAVGGCLHLAARLAETETER